MIKAIILGIVEGLTEFVPISSTGHLIIIGEWLDFVGKNAVTFQIAIQLGAIAAVVFLYWKRWASMLGNPREWCCSEKGAGKLALSHLVMGCAPVFVLGYFCRDFVTTVLFSSRVVAISLVVGGVVMIAVECLLRRIPSVTTLDLVGYKRSLLVGLAQCCALVPGVSRSGATIVGGLLCGMDHKTSAEFSFLLAVPVMMAATGYELVKNGASLQSHEWFHLAVGMLVAFVVAAISIVTFLKLLTRFKLIPFGYYRIFIGLLILLLGN